MQLSLHADYALRVLIYLGTHSEQVVTTRDISEAYGISKHHLVRVAQTLGLHGYIDLVPGRSGGIRLRKHPDEIRLGDVVRDTEPHMRLVECFDAATNTCPIIDCCGLRAHLREASRAFLASLNERTLGGLMTSPRKGQLVQLLGAGAPRRLSPRPVQQQLPARRRAGRRPR